MTVNDMLEELLKVNYKQKTKDIINTLDLTDRQMYIAYMRYGMGWNALKIALYGDYIEQIDIETVYAETREIVAKLGQ